MTPPPETQERIAKWAPACPHCQTTFRRIGTCTWQNRCTCLDLPDFPGAYVEGAEPVRAGEIPEDTQRLDFLEAYCDELEFIHRSPHHADTKLTWFAGDGGGRQATIGATWREAIDRARHPGEPE